MAEQQRPTGTKAFAAWASSHVARKRLHHTAAQRSQAYRQSLQVALISSRYASLNEPPPITFSASSGP